MIESKTKVFVYSNVRMKYVEDLSENIGSFANSVVIVSILSEVKYRRLKRNFIGLFVLRFMTYILFPFIVFIHGFITPRKSILLATSNTFYTPLLLGFSAKLKGNILISYVYDLHPQAMLVRYSGNKLLKLFINAASIIQSIQSKIACRLVFIHQKLAEDFYLYYPTVTTPYNIASVGFTAYAGKLDSVKFDSPSKILLHYGGQLGLMHSPALFGSLINEVSKTEYFKKNFWFNVSTSSMAHHYFGDIDRDMINDALSFGDWENYVIRNVHVGLISISSQGSKVCFPSKMYGYINYGLPLLAICPRNSVLWTEIRENQLGWVIELSSLSNMVRDFLKILNEMNMDELKQIHLSVLDYKNTKLNRELERENWLNIFNESTTR